MPAFPPVTSPIKACGWLQSATPWSSHWSGLRGRASYAKRSPGSIISSISPTSPSSPQIESAHHPDRPHPSLPREQGTVREGACRARAGVRGSAMQDPVVDKIVEHIERAAEHGVPEAARAAAKTFIADTLAVGIAGSKTPWRGEILDRLADIGGGGEAAAA